MQRKKPVTTKHFYARKVWHYFKFEEGGGGVVWGMGCIYFRTSIPI
jgi:hypothetical protein